MSKKSRYESKCKIAIVFLILSVPLQSHVRAISQEPIPTARNYVAWAHEFLLAMYPGLEGKKYTLSLVGYDEYDKPAPQYRSFMLDVGEGPKYEYTRIIGGWSGFEPPPKDFHIGPQYYKQLISTGFNFDAHDRLVMFAAQGTAIGNSDAQNRFEEFMASHPDVTDDVVLTELKSLGAKYGPNDREPFIRNFSTKSLSRFLGPIEVQSVRFLDAGGYAGVSVLGVWEVMVRVTQPSEKPLMYQVDFEEFNGDLVNLETYPNRLTPKASK
jgi:hypothetical protein